MEILLYLIAGLFSILLTAWIFSLIFQPQKQINLLRLNAALLVKIAEKSGVSISEIKNTVARHKEYFPQD